MPGKQVRLWHTIHFEWRTGKSEFVSVRWFAICFGKPTKSRSTSYIDRRTTVFWNGVDFAACWTDGRILPWGHKWTQAVMVHSNKLGLIHNYSKNCCCVWNSRNRRTWWICLQWINQPVQPIHSAAEPENVVKVTSLQWSSGFRPVLSTRYEHPNWFPICERNPVVKWKLIGASLGNTIRTPILKQLASQMEKTLGNSDSL